MAWFIETLRTYPEVAILLSLAIGYRVGAVKFKGFSLGAVTGTLLAAIVIGQFGITVSGPVKSLFFLIFLFAVGYGIGPQFVKGIAKDGLPQAGFSVVLCLLSLAFPLVAAVIAGYDLGSASGLFAGSQTISAAMGLSTDAISRLGLPADRAEQLLSAMPVAYAVTYVFGTVGSAILLAQILPRVMGIDLKQACRDYEKEHGKDEAGGTSWHQYELRAYKIGPGNCAINQTIGNFESGFSGHKVFVEGLRRNGTLMPSGSSTVMEQGDIVAIGGDHDAVVNTFNNPDCYTEVEDAELLAQPVVGYDVYVTQKAVDGKTLKDLASAADAHGVFLRRIKRGLSGAEIPILPDTKLHRGDVLTLSGLEKDVSKAAHGIGVVDQRNTATDVASMTAAMVIGALVGAAVIKVGGIPLTLSTAGGALIAGLIFGWLRSVRPTFGYIPESTVWFMNSVGLNVFIAVVGISAGPNFITGLKELGMGLFLWGIFATSLPLICGAFIAKYVFKFHPAILFGCCAGARTTTAALGMITEQAQSNVPSLGYTVTYAVGNTLLTMWGLAVVLILSRIG